MTLTQRAARVALRDDEASAVRAGRWVRVDLGGWHEVGTAGLRARSALVGRSAAATRAFANVCRHQPLALDVAWDPEWAAPGVRAAPMDERRVRLLCHSHGALFRTTDGLCESGPCEGEALIPLLVEDDGATIVVVVPPPGEPA
jgi:nitrite reductase/ring-hydroxylating ferredoxin subunit